MKDLWPALPLQPWRDTYETLHLWTQIVGKVALRKSPMVNHWWEVALHVTSRGLTTPPIPDGHRTFDFSFDFIDHTLSMRTSDGATRVMALAPRSVADFYTELMDCLGSLGIDARIDVMPSELPRPIPLDQDRAHASYDREQALRFWRILVQVDRVMRKFRGAFLGKASPVHFFWGSFDLAASRFSGRRAPERPEADHLTREGYSHEVISCGWWPGGGNIAGPAFYAYAAPEPPGFSAGAVSPAAAFYNPPTKGYVLMYDDVREDPDPDARILEFFQSAYELAASLGNWDRAELERGSFPVGRKAA